MPPSPWLIVAELVLAIALALGGFFEGVHYETLKVAAAASAAKDTVLAQVQISDAIGDQAVTDQAAALKSIQLVTHTQIVEVPKYVTLQSDRACSIPRGFVSLHDAAAEGVPPVPASTAGADDAPASVDLAAVGATVATNYGKYARCAEDLKALQAWTSAQQQLGN